ncbi:helix-turn-helix transcriptional regulator [Streptomyces sp. NPDC058247]|uniref:helix-turn-helix transcriptional regulator n=1 Tax=Streptomyces sp. NPDC058247 TaxID=3346401 RepID=UPI0036E1F1B2
MEQAAGSKTVRDHDFNGEPLPQKWVSELHAAPAFGAAIGRRLQQVREAKGLTAEEVAKSAQAFGLSWHRPTVGQIERGKRSLNAVELLLLPMVYAQTLEELLPEGTVWLTDDVAASREAVLSALTDVVRGMPPLRKPGGWHLNRDALTSQEFLERTTDDAYRQRARWPIGAGEDVPGDFWGQAPFSPDEAEGKAAKRLGTTPEFVAYAARALWGRGLAAERDERLRARSAAPETPRALQSARGHITRTLIKEMEPTIRAYEEHRFPADPPDRPSETGGEGPSDG